MPSVPSTLDRSDVDAAVWSQQVRHSFFPLDISTDRVLPFAADVRMNALSHCKFARIHASAHTASMSASGCRHLPHRYVKVIWQHQGRAHLDQGGRDVDLPAGHWTVYEASRPYEVQNAGDTDFSVFLCEATGQDGLVSLAQRAAGRAMRTEGGAAIALSTLLAVRNEAGHLAPHSRSVVVDFITALLSREMQFTDGGNVAARRRAQELILREARAYLERQLGEPGLSPDSIAAALHVSRRTLYHAFELAAETPQALIQRLRLEQCRDVLGHARSADTSITQLALEYGFSDPAYFTRAFRQRFGCTPSQYRAQARQGNTGDS